MSDAPNNQFTPSASHPPHERGAFRGTDLHTSRQAASGSQMTPSQTAALQGVDMSVLAGIGPEQLAAIAVLFQSGALQMHPQMPAATSGTTSVAPLQNASAGGGDMNTRVSHRHHAVSEGNLASGAEGLLHAPLMDSRSRSASPRDSQHGVAQQKSGQKSEQDNKQDTVLKQSADTAQASQMNHRTNGGRATHKDTAAQVFVKEMLKAGKTFDELAALVGKPKTLRRMFEELGLPRSGHDELAASSEPARAQSSNVLSSLDNQTATSFLGSRETTTASNIRTPQAEKAAGAAKAPASSRGDYLARLRAAKNKKDAVVSQAAAASVRPTNSASPSSQPVTKSNSLSTSATHRLQPQARSTSSLSGARANDLNGAGKSPNVADVQSKPPTMDKGLPDTSRPEETIQASCTPTGDKRVEQTALARQKLEALRAQQAAKLKNGVVSHKAPRASPVATTRSPTSNRTKGPPPSSIGSLGAGLSDIPSRVSEDLESHTESREASAIAQPSSSTLQMHQAPAPSVPVRSFGGLPGLFMIDTPELRPSPGILQKTSGSVANAFEPTSDSGINMPTQSRSITDEGISTSSMSNTATNSAVIPRKRPVALDFEEALFKPELPKRRFGESRTSLEDKALIIEVSEDGGSDSEDEAYALQSRVVATPSTSARPKQLRDIGPLRDFPAKPNFQVQLSTPGTPSELTYEQKMKEIEAMRLRIAEVEKKQKATAKAPAIAAGSGNNTELPSKGSSSTSGSRPATTESPVSGSMQSTTVNSRSARQQEMEKLKRRMLELEQLSVHRASAKVQSPVTVSDNIQARFDSTPTPTISKPNQEAVPVPNAHQHEDSSVDGSSSTPEEREAREESMIEHAAAPDPPGRLSQPRDHVESSSARADVVTTDADQRHIRSSPQLNGQVEPPPTQAKKDHLEASKFERRKTNSMQIPLPEEVTAASGYVPQADVIVNGTLDDDEEDFYGTVAEQRTSPSDKNATRPEEESKDTGGANLLRRESLADQMDIDTEDESTTSSSASSNDSEDRELDKTKMRSLANPDAPNAQPGNTTAESTNVMPLAPATEIVRLPTPEPPARVVETNSASEMALTEPSIKRHVISDDLATELHASSEQQAASTQKVC